MTIRKNLIAFIVLLYIFSQPMTILAADYQASGAQGPDVKAPAAILIDKKSGQILFQRNAYSVYYPASITKVMTALLVIERTTDFDEMITASHKAVYGIETGSSVMGLSEGESFTVDAILHGLLLRSGNDAAVALAEHIAGGEEEFAKLMTTRAKELGCKNTNFANAHGLPDDNHYTTAYDMALILRQAASNEKFIEVSSCLEYTLPPTPFFKNQERVLYNQNKLITNNEYYNPDVVCSKTGYTDLAKNTLVTYGKRGDIELISVVLYEETGDSYPDTSTLLSYGFDNYAYRQVLDKNSYETSYVMTVEYDGEREVVGETPLTPESSLTVLARVGLYENDITLEPDYTGFTKKNITAGEQVGLLRVKILGEEVGSVPLIASRELSSAAFYERKLLESAQIQTSVPDDKQTATVFSQNAEAAESAEGDGGNPGFNMYIAIAMGVALIGVIIIIAAALIDAKNRREVAMRQRMRRLQRENSGLFD